MARKSKIIGLYRDFYRNYYDGTKPSDFYYLYSENQKEVAKQDEFNCWKCGKKFDRRLTFQCSKCFWNECPFCGACRSPKYGDCINNVNGNIRWSDFEHELRHARLLLSKNKILTFSSMAKLRTIRSFQELKRFVDAEFSKLEISRKREENRIESRRIEKEMNSKGFYKIITITPRFFSIQKGKLVETVYKNSKYIIEGDYLKKL